MPSLLSCPSRISRARRGHEATGPSCRRSGRQPGFNEVRPGSKGCRDRHLRPNAADARRSSPHRDRRADLPPPTASRRGRPLDLARSNKRTGSHVPHAMAARLGAPYHSIQRPARVSRTAGLETRQMRLMVPVTFGRSYVVLSVSYAPLIDTRRTQCIGDRITIPSWRAPRRSSWSPGSGCRTPPRALARILPSCCSRARRTRAANLRRPHGRLSSATKSQLARLRRESGGRVGR